MAANQGGAIASPEITQSEPAVRRVVITGLGVITPLGNTVDALWESLSGGRSGVAPVVAQSGGAGRPPFAGRGRSEFTGLSTISARSKAEPRKPSARG